MELNQNSEYSGTQLQRSTTHGSIIIVYMISWIIHALWLVLISKCGKDIHGTLYCASCTTFLFFTHFDVNYSYDLLLNSHMATQNIFIKWNNHSLNIFFPFFCFFCSSTHECAMKTGSHLWVSWEKQSSKTIVIIAPMKWWSRWLASAVYKVHNLFLNIDV